MHRSDGFIAWTRTKNSSNSSNLKKSESDELKGKSNKPTWSNFWIMSSLELQIMNMNVNWLNGLLPLREFYTATVRDFRSVFNSRGSPWQMAGKKSPALPLFRTPAGERSGSSVIMVDRRLKSQVGKILWMVYQLQDPQINGLEHLTFWQSYSRPNDAL